MGAVIVLLSVFLTWLKVSFLFTVELSLWQLVRLTLESQNGVQEPLALVTLILVIVGGIIAFAHSIGGVVPLLGVGFFLFQIESSVEAAALVSYGIGLFAAILGSIVVILAAAIPKEKKKEIP